MQAGVFMAVLFTTAYAPQELLTGWLADVAKFNPVTLILEAVRQGFVGRGDVGRHVARPRRARRDRGSWSRSRCGPAPLGD